MWIPLPLRAWWWSSRPSEKWPREVREYLIRRGLKLIRKGAKDKSPEEITRAATEMMARALPSDAGDVSEVLRTDVFFEGLRLLASVPRTTCANCNRPIAIHEATKIGQKHYCEGCAGRIQ